MGKHVLESAIEAAVFAHGFTRVRARSWTRPVGDCCEAGVLTYGLSRVAPGTAQFEVVFSLSYLPVARVLNWSSSGLRRPQRRAHPTLTWNATDRFPDGRLWSARIEGNHGAAHVTQELSEILKKYFVPYAREHGSLSAIGRLVGNIGGWTAFQFQFALLILDREFTPTMVLRLARSCGVEKARAKTLMVEYAAIPGSYVDACKYPRL